MTDMSDFVHSPGALVDKMERTIRYLRVSVTDRCNFRCVYCHPTEDWTRSRGENLLSVEEIVRFVGWMTEQGVRKVRLTGGEPLVRKDIVTLVQRLKEIDKLETVVMTTNGYLLPKYAKQLKGAGLDRVNVSLDTVNEALFARMVRGDHFRGVIEGLCALDDAGFRDTQINAVLVDEVEEDERFALAEFAWRRGYTPRFIEMMPIGDLDYQTKGTAASSEGLVEAFNRKYGLATDESKPTAAGPAKFWQVTDGEHKGARLGTISPMSDRHFCGTCNRARLTVSGGFRGCLGSDNEVRLLHYIRTDRKSECIGAVREALSNKAPSHLMTEPGFVPLSAMVGIGG